MNRSVIFIVTILPVVFALAFASTYDRHWTVGRYGMPRTLLAPDGNRFKDGEPLDDLTSALVQSGHEEEVYLVGVALQVVLWLALAAKLQKAGKTKPENPGRGLDSWLMRWNDKDRLSRRHLLNGGVLIMGRPGSGKTSSSGMTLGRSIVRDPLGTMLILSAKPEDAVMWQRIFRENNRELLVVSPESRLKCNMLDFLGKCGADTREIVTFITTSAEVLGVNDQSGGENGMFFENEQKRFLHHAIEILRQAGVSISSPRIQNFVNSAAQSPEQFQSDVWRDQFHNECLRKASAKKKSEREKYDFELARDAWIKEWPVMASRTRSSVLACILDTLFHFNAGIGREALASETTCSPLDLLRGKSILINYPPCEYGDSGALIASCWKFLTQKTILGRSFKRGDYYSIIWADEAYQFTTSFDQIYANSSRSHGGAMVYLAQSRDSFYSALGVKKIAFANGLIGAFHHKIFHALGSPDDAAWASSLLGQQMETSYGGSVQPAGDCFDAAFGHVLGQSRVQTSFNQSWQPLLQPAVFQNGLRCGGNGPVDAIVVRSGEPFQSTGKNFIFATFNQR